MTIDEANENVRNGRETIRILAAGIREVTEGNLSLIARYDQRSFRLLDADNSQPNGIEDRIGPYYALDFVEHQLTTEELYPGTSSVLAEVKVLNDRQIVSVYADQEALLVIVDPEEPVDPIIQLVHEECEEVVARE